MKSDIEATQQQVTTLETTLKYQETELEKSIEEIKGKIVLLIYFLYFFKYFL